MKRILQRLCEAEALKIGQLELEGDPWAGR